MTVNIADVYPDAVQIKAWDLKSSDKVFDTTGGRHGLLIVTKLRSGRVRFYREDRPEYPEYLDRDELITVVRKS